MTSGVRTRKQFGERSNYFKPTSPSKFSQENLNINKRLITPTLVQVQLNNSNGQKSKERSFTTLNTILHRVLRLGHLFLMI